MPQPTEKDFFCKGAQVANTVLDAYESGKLQEALQDGAGGFKVPCPSLEKVNRTHLIHKFAI